MACSACKRISLGDAVGKRIRAVEKISILGLTWAKDDVQGSTLRWINGCGGRHGRWPVRWDVGGDVIEIKVDGRVLERAC